MTIEWAPESCTLPTTERPLREAEFDAVFARSVWRAERLAADRLRLWLEPTAEVAARVAGLAVREVGCCSFFTFTQTVSSGRLSLDIGVPPGRVDVLDALESLA